MPAGKNFNYRRLAFTQSGLTLLELIVVIAIVSVLSGIFVTIYYNVTHSKLSEYTRDELEELKEALLDFYRDLDQFPKDTNSITTDFLDLERNPSSASRFDASDSSLQTWRQNKWNGPYIQDKFNDNDYMKDAWQKDYIYDYTYGDDYCTITSYGPDRTSGGGDDITITVNARDIKNEKIRKVQDELDIIQLALKDYIRATGGPPSSIDDLFEWELLNLHMDESSWTGATDEVVDYSGMGHHGTAYNGATTTTGKVGQGGTFDGTNDYVALNMYFQSGDTLPKFTVEVWYKTSFSGGGWTSNWAFLDFDRSEWFNVYIRPNDGKLAFSGSDGINDYFDTYGNTASNDGNWHQGIVVYDSSNNFIKFYLDGELDRTVSYGNMNPISDSTTRYGFVGDGSEASTFNGGRNGIYYNGLIDEVRMYKVALSADEIRKHYENPGYPRDYFDLHDYALKYDEWENKYALGSKTVGGQTVYYFYSYGPDRADDSGSDDDILPRGLTP